MRLSELYHKAIEIGMKYDPRDGGAAESDLKRTKAEYDDMDDVGKKYFDADLLWNPYPDSRPVCGDDGGVDPEFSKVVVCIETPNTTIVRYLSPNLLITHHPDGRASAGLHRVLDMQIGIWRRYGVSIDAIDTQARESSIRRLMSCRNARTGKTILVI